MSLWYTNLTLLQNFRRIHNYLLNNSPSLLTAVDSTDPVQNPPRVNAVPDPSVARGQTTAILTGAISIIFGVAYLALVQFMDMRGGELLPPPPEAFIP
jgi:hypothetical protein